MEFYRDDKIIIGQSAQDIGCIWIGSGEADRKYMEKKLMEWYKSSKLSEIPVIKEGHGEGNYYKMKWLEEPNEMLRLSPSAP